MRALLVAAAVLFAAGPILRFRRGSAEVGINLESWRGAILEVYVDHAVAR